MTYGIQNTGFVRKPLATILAEIEALMRTEFGPDVIQTAQSPLGQINGIFSEGVSKIWELSEDLYSSLDPDQTEEVRLDILARIRRIERGASELDTSFRQAITNEGQGRVDLQDISRAVAALDDVTYSHVWVNDSYEQDANGMPSGSLCVAVTGGEDVAIAEAIRKYVVPGVITFGNHPVTVVIEGYGRTFRLLRPIEVPVTLTVNIDTFKDDMGNPPPSSTAIKAKLIESFDLLNGVDVDAYAVRSIIEKAFSNVRVTSIAGSRDNLAAYSEVEIGFIERASISHESVTISVN